MTDQGLKQLAYTSAHLLHPKKRKLEGIDFLCKHFFSGWEIHSKDFKFGI